MKQYGLFKTGSSKIHPHNECFICSENNKCSKKKARRQNKKIIQEQLTEYFKEIDTSKDMKR